MAEGYGTDARAMSTAEASAAVISSAGLVIAGAPVHSLNLPSEQTRQWAQVGHLGPGGAPPDLLLPMMRTWLEKLPKGVAYTAAFDTRVKPCHGWGAASRILAHLRRAGYQLIARPHGFCGTGQPVVPRTKGVLRDGEVERAREWGSALARSIARLTEP